MESSASKPPDEQRSQAWAAIGASLVTAGGVGVSALVPVGASSHLWGDDAFLAGFALACLLVALGVYVLVGEFLGGLPLPPTRREREERRRRAQRQSGFVETASPPATRPPHPRALIGHASELRIDGTEQERKLVTRRAHVLFRRIVETELKTTTLPPELHQIVYYNLADPVEAWTRRLGGTDEVPEFSGNLAADLPRLKVFVQTQLDRWRAISKAS